MVVGKIGRCAAALMLVGFVAAGCTPDAPSPPSSPTPPPTPSVSQIPSETAQERQQRVDYEAAEKSYRAFRAEYNRVLRAGGATEPTALMKETAGGPYLNEFAQAIEAYKGLGSFDSGFEKIVYIRRNGYSPEAVVLQVCEDSRAIETFNKARESQGRGDILKITLEVRRGDRWRVWSGAGGKVDSCR